MLNRLFVVLTTLVGMPGLFALPAHAATIYDGDTGLFTDDLNTSPAFGTVSNLTSTGGTLQAAAGQSGSFTTNEIMVPSSYGWKKLFFKHSMSAGASITVSFKDLDTNATQSVNWVASSEPGYTGEASIPFGAATKRLSVTFTLNGTGAATPVILDQYRLTWTPKAVLAASLAAPASVASGASLLQTLYISNSFVEARDVVALIPLAAGTKTPSFGQVSQLVGQAINAPGGAQTGWGPATLPNGQTVPANHAWIYYPSIAAGKTFIITVTSQVPNGTLNATSYTNTAQLSAQRTTASGTALSADPVNVSTAPTLVTSSPNLEIRKNVVGGAYQIGSTLYANANTDVTYQVTVTNRWTPQNGAHAYNLVVADDFKAIRGNNSTAVAFPNNPTTITAGFGVGNNTNPYAGQPSLNPIAPVTNEYFWKIDRLSVGESRTFTFTVRLNTAGPLFDGSNGAKDTVTNPAWIESAFSEQAGRVNASAALKVGVIYDPLGIYAKGDWINGSGSVSAVNDDNVSRTVTYGSNAKWLLAVRNGGFSVLTQTLLVDKVSDLLDFNYASLPLGADNKPMGKIYYYYKAGNPDPYGVNIPREFPPELTETGYNPATTAASSLLGASWSTTLPPNPAQVRWVAFYIPAVSPLFESSPTISLSGVPGMDTTLTASPANSVTAEIAFTVRPPTANCQTQSAANLGLFKTYGYKTPTFHGPTGAVNAPTNWGAGDSEQMTITPILPAFENSTMYASPNVVLGANTTTFVFQFSNNDIGAAATDPANNVVATITVPTVVANGVPVKLPVVSINAGPDGIATVTPSGDVTVTYPPTPGSVLPPGANRAIQVQVQVPKGVANGTTFTAQGRVTGEDDVCGAIQGSASASASVTVTPYLSIAKLATHEFANKGADLSDLQYVLSHINLGEASTRGVTIVDKLPTWAILDSTGSDYHVKVDLGARVFFSENPNFGIPETDINEAFVLNPANFALGSETPPGSGKWFAPGAGNWRYVAVLPDQLIGGSYVYPTSVDGIPRKVYVNVEIAAGAPDTAVLYNDSEIRSAELLAATSNVVNTSVSGDPSLVVDKECLPEVAANSEPFTLATTWRNASTNPDNNVVLTETLPAGTNLLRIGYTLPNGAVQPLTAYGSVPGNFSVSGSAAAGWTVAWNLGAQLAPAAFASLQEAKLVVEVSLTGASTGTWFNFSSQGTANNASNAQGIIAGTSCIILAANPDLAVRKLVDIANPVPGEVVTFRLEVSNQGPHTADNVVITDTLPAIFTYVPGSTQVLSAGWRLGAAGAGDDNPVLSGGNYVWSLALNNAMTSTTAGVPAGTIPGGQTVVLTYRATLGAAAQPGNAYNNCVAVTNTWTEDPNTHANTACVPVTPPLPDPRMVKTGTTEALAGDRVSYQLAFSNTSRMQAQNVYFVESLPDSFQLPAGDPRKDPADVAGPDVTFHSVSLPSGSPGLEVYYHATAGAAPAFNYATPTANGWSGSPTSPVSHMAFRLTGIMPGYAPTRTANVEVELRKPDDSLPLAGTTFVNCATIRTSDAQQSQAFPNPGADTNDTSCAETQIPGVDLRLTKLCGGPCDERLRQAEAAERGQTYTPDVTCVDPTLRVQPGDPARFVLRVANTGTEIVRGVKLTDALPAGLTYVADSSATMVVTDRFGAESSPVDAAGTRINDAAWTRSGMTWYLGNNTASSDSRSYLNVGLAAGDVAYIQVEVLIDRAVLDDEVLTNAATVVSDNPGPEPEENTANNVSDCFIKVDRPNVFVRKSVSLADGSSGPAHKGDTVTYTVEYGIEGGVPAYDTRLTDYFPTGIDFIQGSLTPASPAGGGSLSHQGNADAANGLWCPPNCAASYSSPDPTQPDANLRGLILSWSPMPSPLGGAFIDGQDPFSGTTSGTTINADSTVTADVGATNPSYTTESVGAAAEWYQVLINSAGCDAPTRTPMTRLVVASQQPKVVATFDVNAEGAAVPLTTISGQNTGMVYPWGITVDPATDDLVIGDYGAGQVMRYPPSATGDLPPATSLTVGDGAYGPSRVLVDRVHNELYVPNEAGGDVAYRVYAADATGNDPPLRVVGGANTLTTVWGSDAVAIDYAADEVYVTGYSTGWVLVFDRQANGDVAPKRMFRDATNTDWCPPDVEIDTERGEVLVLDNCEPAISVFPLGASGDVTPLRKIAGVNPGFGSINGFVHDPVSGEIFVADERFNQVYVFDYLDDGDVAPKRTLSWDQPSDVALGGGGSSGCGGATAGQPETFLVDILNAADDSVIPGFSDIQVSTTGGAIAIDNITASDIKVKVKFPENQGSGGLVPASDPAVTLAGPPALQNGEAWAVATEGDATRVFGMLVAQDGSSAFNTSPYNQPAVWNCIGGNCTLETTLPDLGVFFYEKVEEMRAISYNEVWVLFGTPGFGHEIVVYTWVGDGWSAERLQQLWGEQYTGYDVAACEGIGCTIPLFGSQALTVANAPAYSTPIVLARGATNPIVLPHTPFTFGSIGGCEALDINALGTVLGVCSEDAAGADMYTLTAWVWDSSNATYVERHIFPTYPSPASAPYFAAVGLDNRNIVFGATTAGTIFSIIPGADPLVDDWDTAFLASGSTYTAYPNDRDHGCYASIAPFDDPPVPTLGAWVPEDTAPGRFRFEPISLDPTPDTYLAKDVGPDCELATSAINADGTFFMAHIYALENGHYVEVHRDDPLTPPLAVHGVGNYDFLPAGAMSSQGTPIFPRAPSLPGAPAIPGSGLANDGERIAWSPNGYAPDAYLTGATRSLLGSDAQTRTLLHDGNNVLLAGATATYDNEVLTTWPVVWTATGDASTPTYLPSAGGSGAVPQGKILWGDGEGNLIGYVFDADGTTKRGVVWRLQSDGTSLVEPLTEGCMDGGWAVPYRPFKSGVFGTCMDSGGVEYPGVWSFATGVPVFEQLLPYGNWYGIDDPNDFQSVQAHVYLNEAWDSAGGYGTSPSSGTAVIFQWIESETTPGTYLRFELSDSYVADIGFVNGTWTADRRKARVGDRLLVTELIGPSAAVLIPVSVGATLGDFTATEGSALSGESVIAEQIDERHAILGTSGGVVSVWLPDSSANPTSWGQPIPLPYCNEYEAVLLNDLTGWPAGHGPGVLCPSTTSDAGFDFDGALYLYDPVAEAFVAYRLNDPNGGFPINGSPSTPDYYLSVRESYRNGPLVKTSSLDPSGSGDSYKVLGYWQHGGTPGSVVAATTGASSADFDLYGNPAPGVYVGIRNYYGVAVAVLGSDGTFAFQNITLPGDYSFFFTSAADEITYDADMQGRFLVPLTNSSGHTEVFAFIPDQEGVYSATATGLGGNPSVNGRIQPRLLAGDCWTADFTTSLGATSPPKLWGCSLSTAGGGGGSAVLTDITVSYATGEPQTLTYQGVVQDVCEARITNDVSIATSSVETTTADNSASASIDIVQSDIEVTVTRDYAVVGGLAQAPGNVITYTVSVRNLGPYPARSVTVDFAGETDASLITYAGTQTMTWTDFPVNTTQTFQVVGTVQTNTAGTVLAAQARVANNSEIDCNEVNDTSSTLSIVGEYPNVYVHKSAPQFVNAGDTFQYVITVGNNGNTIANNVQVLDTWPAGVTPVSAVLVGDPSYVFPDLANGVLLQGESIDDGIEGHILVTVRTSSDCATIGDVLRNVVTISAPNDIDTADNQDAAETTVLAPSAAMEAYLVQSESLLEPGQTLTYTGYFSSTGSDAVLGPTVTITLGTNVTVIPDSITGGGQVVGNTVVWDTAALGAVLEPGGVGSVTVAVVVGQTGPFLASIEATGDNICPYDPLVAANVSPFGGGLQLVKSADTNAACVDGTVAWTILVTNTGLTTINSIQVADTVPAGYVPGSIHGVGAAEAGAPNLLWNVGTLAPGAGTTLGYSTAAPAVGETLVNTARATAANGVTVTSNEAAIAVDCNAVLSLTKDWTAGCLVPGGTVDVTLTYTNEGDEVLTGALVEDYISPEFSDVTGLGGGASFNAATRMLSASVGDLLPGESGTVTFTLTLSDALPGGEVVLNRGQVSANGVAPMASNQVASLVIDCDDNDPCTIDTCDTSGTCQHLPIDLGGACDDGDACTTGEVCVNGACGGGNAVTCDDGEVCTDDSCDPAIGCVNTADDTNTCADSDLCTTDACVAGACVSSPVVCDDGASCSTESCNPTTGACDYVYDDTACVVAGAGACSVGVCDPSLVGADPSTGCAVTSQPDGYIVTPDVPCGDGACGNFFGDIVCQGGAETSTCDPAYQSVTDIGDTTCAPDAPNLEVTYILVQNATGDPVGTLRCFRNVATGVVECDEQTVGSGVLKVYEGLACPGVTP